MLSRFLSRCLVEVVGARGLVACVYPINEGMEIVTNSQLLLMQEERRLSYYFPITKKIVCNVQNKANVNY